MLEFKYLAERAAKLSFSYIGYTEICFETIYEGLWINNRKKLCDFLGKIQTIGGTVFFVIFKSNFCKL